MQVLTAYATKINADVKSVRFLFDGVRIKNEDTPETLGMEDGEQVDAALEQHGVARRA